MNSMTATQRDLLIDIIGYIGFKRIRNEYGGGLQYSLTIEKVKYDLIIKLDTINDLYYCYMKINSDDGWVIMNMQTIKEYFKDIIRENKLKSLIDEK